MTRDRLLLAILGVAGVVGAIAGTAALIPDELIGFDPGGALRGLLHEAPGTLLPGLVVLAVAAVEVIAGAALARLILARPFEGLPELLLAGFTAAVLKDLVLLGTLGQVGLFHAPFLFAADVGLLVLGRQAMPWLVRPDGRTTVHVLRAAGPWSVPFVALIALAWIGPLLLQLASPVVPFIDVLPNHVAPAEHLRIFGGLDPLSATQSPIYGPSRTLLGYVGFAGAVTTLAGLPAALAISCLILPTSLLVAAAAYRLGDAIGGPGAAAWTLLAFATTASFARIGDVRGTVVVLPIVAWSFAMLADHLAVRTAGDRGRPVLSEGVLLGLGLAAAIFVHPVIGALALGTVVGVALFLPATVGRLGLIALAVSAVAASPQALTMLGLALPPLALVVALGAGIAGGLALERWLPRSWQRLGDHRTSLGVLAALFLLAAVAAGFLLIDQRHGTIVANYALLLGALIVGALFRVPAARSPILQAAGLGGLGVAIVAALIPTEGLGLLGIALAFELPKTLYYWLPVVVAVAAGSALEAAWNGGVGLRRIPWPIRRLGVGIFVVVLALPVRATPIDAAYLGERRLSEALATDLHFVERGFWIGFPNSRRLVNGPRVELIAAVRREIDAGRIGPDTPILHVARSFQQWVATPLGVFTGVTETDVSLDAEHSIHTVGGRLRDMSELDALLAGGAYPYLLFEPDEKLPADALPRIVDAGYRAIFSNAQGILFVLDRA